MTDLKLINKLEPKFAGKVKDLKILVLMQTGYEWFVIQGRRTIAEQDRLYEKGRTAPGNKVTNAKGGQSPHNFGLAVDMVPIKDGKAWWSAPDSLWKQYADTAKSIGLVAGYYFNSIHDAPHVETPDWKDQQALWKTGKIQVV